MQQCEQSTGRRAGCPRAPPLCLWGAWIWLVLPVRSVNDRRSPVPSPPAPKPELLGSTICVLLTWPRTWQTLGGPKCFKGMSSQIISNFYLCSLDSTILSFHLSSIINHKHNRQIYAFDSNYLRESEWQLQTQ